MDKNQLNSILEKHAAWLRNEKGGERADLSEADLSGADLSGADLSGADLRRACLSGADLRRACLSGADLSGADLRRACLSEAAGVFAIGYFGRHHAIAAGGYISIGCERYTYQKWVDEFVKIGKENHYSNDEIARYGEWIKIVVSWLEKQE